MASVPSSNLQPSSRVSDPNQSTCHALHTTAVTEARAFRSFANRLNGSSIAMQRSSVQSSLHTRSCTQKHYGINGVSGSPFRIGAFIVRCDAAEHEPTDTVRNVTDTPSRSLSTQDGLSAVTASSKFDVDDSSKLHVHNGDTGGYGGDDEGSSSNGNGAGGNGGGHGNNNDGDDEKGRSDDSEEKEFGSLLNAEEVSREVQSRGIKLPADMAEAARTVGIRSFVLTRYMDFQAAQWPLGAAIRASSMLRNRMLADQSFLFKLLTEIAIDSGCATFAEVKKRGDDFWNEFELYMADLIVGIVVDAALVAMLAPYIQFGRAAPSSGLGAHLSRLTHALPSSVFEAATPGRRFTIQQRTASYFYKGVQYGAVGFSCGIIGQGIANAIMLLKRKLKKSEEKDVPVPPLVKSAALWGFFLAVSSNTRYQLVNGLERVVEGSSVGKKLPVVAMAFTVCIRFANNTYGGMQFVDWARWSGVQ